MNRRPTLTVPAESVAFLKTFTPSRRKEVQKYLELYNSDILNLLNDEQLATTMRSMLKDTEAEDLINIAGSGYRKLDGQLNRGPEKGKYKLVADNPKDYSEEEQDILELLSLMKQYDYQMSGARNKQPEQSFLKDKINQVVKNNLTSASVRYTGKGGTIGERSKNPLLPQLTDESAQEATTKFLMGNLSGNEIGEQPISLIDRLGNRSSLPIEHTKVAFENDPSKGLDVDNRDLGSTLVNSVIRSETNTDRIAELLYKKIADKAEYIKDAYGVPYRTIMDEWDMDYQVGQRDWDPNMYMGESAVTTGNVSGDKPIIVNADKGANVFVHTNGKNGNGHADMQKEFRETSRGLKR